MQETILSLAQVTLVLTWVIDSPISPESWLMSLLFVVIITMIKQGYEDYLRSIMLNLLYFNSKTIDPGKSKVSFKVNSLLIFDQLPLKDQLDVHNICFNYLHHKPTISYFRSLPVIIMSI